MKRLDEILAYCEKATKGPFGVEVEITITERTLKLRQQLPSGDFVPISLAKVKATSSEDDANFSFFAQARTDLPLVTEYTKRLEAENEKLREALNNIVREGDRFREEAVMDWDGVQDIAQRALAEIRAKLSASAEEEKK